MISEWMKKQLELWRESESRDAVVLNKMGWLLNYRPESADEAFNLLWEQHEEQQKYLLRMTESLIYRPHHVDGHKL